MWYEMLPAMFLSGGLLFIPHVVVGALNKSYLGTPYRRLYSTDFHILMMFRDQRLAQSKYQEANHYKLVGLESIPDPK